MWSEEICQMKNSNDKIWNRTRDLPACSALPQPTAPPCAPSVLVLLTKYYSSGQIEEDGMGRPRGTYGEQNRNAYRVCLRIRKERDSLEDVGIDGKVIKRIVKDQEGIKQPGLT